MTRTAATLRIALLAAASLPALWGCDGEGNTGRRPISDDLAEVIPWINGRPPVTDADGRVDAPDEPSFPPIATGAPDPGSGPVDCRRVDEVQFSRVWFDDFEADPEIDDAVGIAPAWAGYDDGSEGSWRSPGFVDWYPGLAGRYPAIWGTPADRIVGEAPSCRGEPNGWALHFKGGRFNLFGAGIGHPMADLNPCPPDSDSGHPDDRLCPPAPDEDDEVDAAGFPTSAPGGEPYSVPHLWWDVSGFDGIAFWARRGPEGSGILTVSIQDKHTADILNRENQTFCRPLVGCRTACENRMPCSPVDADDPDSEHRCFDPEQGQSPSKVPAAFLNDVYPRCGPSACRFDAGFPNPEFEGKACRRHTFQSHGTGEYCFDPGDEPPPDTGERCGDGYARAVNLTTDWQFFTVPFAEMRQAGFGRVSPFMDLTTVSNVNFAVPLGWADVWIDNVTLYRERP